MTRDNGPYVWLSCFAHQFVIHLQRCLTKLLKTDYLQMETTDFSTEQLILAAAEQEFLLHGYDGTKTVNIARRAGVNHALLHYYYRTKENLFNHIFTQKIQLFGRSLVESFDAQDTPLQEQILAAAGRHFDFLVENAGLSRLLLGEMLRNPKRLEQFRVYLDTMKSDVLDPLQVAIDAEVAAGRMAPVNAVMLAMDIVQLNICAVVMQPFVAMYANDLGERTHFLRLRKEENLRLICGRLEALRTETVGGGL